MLVIHTIHSPYYRGVSFLPVQRFQNRPPKIYTYTRGVFS